jgi:hypothetical protein
VTFRVRPSGPRGLQRCGARDPLRGCRRLRRVAGGRCRWRAWGPQQCSRKQQKHLCWFLLTCCGGWWRPGALESVTERGGSGGGAAHPDTGRPSRRANAREAEEMPPRFARPCSPCRRPQHQRPPKRRGGISHPGRRAASAARIRMRRVVLVISGRRKRRTPPRGRAEASGTGGGPACLRSALQRGAPATYAACLKGRVQQGKALPGRGLGAARTAARYPQIPARYFHLRKQCPWIPAPIPAGYPQTFNHRLRVAGINTRRTPCLAGI